MSKYQRENYKIKQLNIIWKNDTVLESITCKKNTINVTHNF